MKKYDNYKDSGIEWIREIPEHWEVKKLKFISKICNGQDQKAVLEDDGIYPVYGSGGVFGRANSYLFDQPSVLLGRKGTIDRPQYVEEPFWTVDTSYYTKIREGFSVRLFYYLCTTINFDLYKYGSAIPSMTQGHLNEIKFSIPNTLDEQTIIANYLDYKTTQIDTLITKKEQFISLLQEERTALINQAVTKGLDPTVKMKDSGIEWLGEIPEHWVEARIKNVVNVIGRIGFRGYTVADLVQKGEGAISLSPSNIKNHLLNIDDCTYLSWEKYHESPEIKIYENDIVLVKTGSTIGKTAIIPANTPEMTLNPQLVVFKDIKLNPLFLYYMMVSNYFQGYFSIYTAGGSTPAISQEKINNFKITFPKIEEQIQISNFIAKKELEIKSIITKSQLEIELLKEYKTALISEVVTGKVDVRETILN
ncbi:restriction endonuclease subunit S [Flavobacterium petrolei]|uniref:restriction endonuclease subunit S n=1 Tax=Flavobacterium petrolei TaxID=2259594 RepID=UPI003756804D